jgi:hypothetical protein
MPSNGVAVLRNDLVSGVEDGPLFVIPAEAFGNDIEPDGDVLFFKRAAVLGQVDHRFLSPDYEASARMADGSALPDWLSFDAATMRFVGTAPAGQTAPLVIDVWIHDPANERVFNHRFDLSPSQLAAGYDAGPAVLSGYEVRTAYAREFQFGANDLDASTVVAARQSDGSALPDWLAFDPATLRFSGTPPLGATTPLTLELSFTRPAPAGGAPLVWTDTMTLDPAAAATGVVYDSNLALFDLANGSVSASLLGGRPLPDWLNFDAATRTVGLSGFDPETDAQPARLQVIFTPAARNLAAGTYASSDRGFTLEFAIDPHGDLAAAITAINAVLAGDPYFAAQGLFALDLDGAGPITAARESLAPLPSWLGFDAATLSFTGTPPPAWVGAVPVRLDIEAGAGTPAMSVITEVVIDDTFRLAGASVSASTSAEQIDLHGTGDFEGTLVLSYDATDEKGGVSASPALIFYDVAPTRERPDTVADDIAAREGETTRFAISDLLGNDFDPDGDRLHVVELSQPVHGALAVELAHVVLAPPAGLDQAPGAVWSAELADGTVLPAWLVIDTATGVLSGDIPLAYAAALDIRVTRTLGESSQSATLHHDFDGNLGAYGVYTPAGAFSGDDRLTYVVSDSREGTSNGAAILHVAPVADPPVAVADTVTATEDAARIIDPATLLANDYDVDDDPIRFVGVANAVHGSVAYDATGITFTPEADFSGTASFEYIVTDDVHGSSTGQVTVNVASTNRAPVAALDLFEASEDTPFEFTKAQLLANDSDADGDAISFQSISRGNPQGRLIELPGGRFQFVPNENVSGPIEFSYVIGDGRAASVGTVRFDVAAVNDAPIANPDGAGTGNDPAGVFSLKQDEVLVIDFAALIANDRDVEGDAFEVVEVFDADQGTVTQVGATAEFTPDDAYIGDAGFHYRVTDSHGATSVGFVTLLVYPDFPLPVASSDLGFEVLEDHSLDIDPALLLANDTAPEGSTLTFLGLEGATLLDNGKYRVTPAADFNGELVLRYSIQNEQGFPVSTTVSITVLPVADAPVARGDALSLGEDAPLTIFTSQLLANDSDADLQAIVLGPIVGASGLTVVDLGFGQLKIVPDADFNGEAWFDYEVADSTGLTATARVAVSIAAANDTPVIAAIPVLQGIEDQPFSAVLPEGFASDVDGDALVVEVRGAGGAPLPVWLGYDRETRTLSGSPPANFYGVVALEIAASDGTVQALRQLLVSIGAVNDAPSLADGVADVTLAEEAGFNFAISAGAFADVDGDALTIAVTLANSDPLPDWMQFDGAVLSGAPPADFNGELTLRATASDGQASVSDDFVLRVTAVNDAPYVAHPLADVTSGEDAAIDLLLPADAFADADGDPLALSAALVGGAALPAWLEFDGARFTGTPPANFNGQIDIRVTASDALVSVHDDFRLTISAENDPPFVLSALADIHSAEDAAFTYTLPADAFADPEGDSLTYTARLAGGAALPSWLSLVDGVLSGTPPQDFTGSLDIEILASDGHLAASEVVRLTIDPLNDAPVIVTPVGDLVAAEDHAISLPVASDGFADADGDALTFSISLANGDPLPAWLSYANGSLVGTPPADFNGVLALAITASDGVSSTTDTFQLSILAVNDAPTVATLLPDRTAAEDQPIDVTIDPASFADVEGDVLALSARLADGQGLPAWLDFDGTRFTGTPPADFSGFLDVEVFANDGLLSVSDVFRLTIDPMNDAPVQAGELPDVSSQEDGPVAILLPSTAFEDVDGDALSYSARLTDGAALPAWLVFSGNAFTGTPPADFNGALDVTVTASDGSLSASGSFRLSITAVNDAPVLAIALPDQTVTGGDAIDLVIPIGSFTYVDGDPLTFTAALADGSSLPSWLLFDGGRFSGASPSTYSGLLDVRVTATDGALEASDRFMLTVEASNQAPDAADDGLFITLQAQELVILATDLLGNDIDQDGDALTITAVAGALHGTVSINDDGNIVYSADGDYVGTDSFTYTVSDGVLSDTAVVNVRADSIFETWSQGSSGADKLFGNHDESSHLYGGAGNDQIKGGKEADWLAGGDGDDHLNGLSGDDQFWGNDGNDLLNGNGGFDTANFFGLRSSYSVATVNGTVRIVDTAPLADGDDGSDTISSIERLIFKNGETASVVSPIVLDLDGKGVETISASKSRAIYDFDGDGIGDDTSWIGKTEAFLFIDRNGDGTVSGAGELSFVDDVPNATSDLAGLVAFDSNGDGKLSAGDARFDDLGLWVDRNGNGTVEKGEVNTLAEAEVASLDLQGTAAEGTTAFGEVAIVNVGNYTTADGRRLKFIDAALTYFSLPERTNGRKDAVPGPGAQTADTSVAPPFAGGIANRIPPTIPSRPFDPLSSPAWRTSGQAPRSAFDLSSDSAAFDRYEGGEFDPVADPAAELQLPESGATAMAATGGDIGLAGLTVRTAAEGLDTARRLAMLRQDIAAFGGGSGDVPVAWWNEEKVGLGAFA